MEDLDQGQVTPAPRPPRGWWSRNWLWFVPTTLLVMVVLCGGCCGGLFLLAISKIKSSEPYQMALEQVQNDPQVIEQLGEPIEEASWLPVGEITVENGGGEARLDFDVAGPKGKAHVRAQARRVAGKWGRLASLEVTPEGGQRILLDTGADEELEEAPLFQP